jgi:hypothetical protein
MHFWLIDDSNLGVLSNFFIKISHKSRGFELAMSLTRTSMSLKYHILIENKCILFLIKWCFNKLNCQLSEANRPGNIDKRALRKP